MIVNLENEVEKNHWVKKLADDLNVTESALTDELKKINLKDRITNSNSTLENISEKADKKNITKKEMLTRELIGLMLACPIIWQEVVKIKEENNLDLGDSLYDLMIKIGENVAFKFDAFLGEIGEQREAQEKAQKLFVAKKYRLDLNNNSEEINIENPLEELKHCIFEIKKEEKREALNQISLDLKVAEERGDNEAKMFLRQESDRLTKELYKLSQ
jgi:hypothetical protein